MLDKTIFRWIKVIYLLVLFSVGCAPDDPEATPLVVTRGTVTPMVVPTRTPSPGFTPRLVAFTPTSAAAELPAMTPTIPTIPGQTSTPISLPLPPMSSFPTVTPDYRVYETKPIFLSYGGYGGDGGSVTDEYLGRGTPWLVIYGDGQFLIHEGTFDDSTFLEATLTPAEMCNLRQQIEATGFMEPHEEFFTERDESMGAGSTEIRVEETFYSFYVSDMQYLVEDLARGVDLIENYRPPRPLTPYSPEYLILWIEEMQPDDQEMPVVWPSELPSLGELWSDREQNKIFIEGEWVIPIFDLFSRRLVQKIFQEGDKTYALIARPLLPHETPYRFSYFPGLPRDYVTVLSCEGDPTFLSPAVATATPTLTSSVARLTGQGRIAFVTGTYDEREIFVSEANGTSRLRLTNNQFADDEPAWSPDGQRIAFVSERSGNRDVFVMDADGRNVVQLTNDTADDYSPTWSPDGEKIAFISDRDGGWSDSEIFMMNADGSEPVQLTDDTVQKTLPVWSPDGRKIVFVKGVFISVLYLDSGTTENLISYSVQSVSRPTWSPDSSLVVTATDSNREEAKIRFINLESGEIESVSIPRLELPASLDWSVNGNYILFSAREPNEGENAIHYSEDSSYRGNWNIYSFDVSLQEIIQITYTQQDELSPAWWP